MLHLINEAPDLVTTISAQATHLANWVQAAPDPGGGTPPPGSEKFLTLLRWVAWIMSGVCVLGVLIAGGSMALAVQGRGAGHETVSRLGWVLAGCIVIGSASGLVGALV